MGKTVVSIAITFMLCAVPTPVSSSGAPEEINATCTPSVSGPAGSMEQTIMLKIQNTSRRTFLVTSVFPIKNAVSFQPKNKHDKAREWNFSILIGSPGFSDDDIERIKPGGSYEKRLEGLRYLLDPINTDRTPKKVLSGDYTLTFYESYQPSTRDEVRPEERGHAYTIACPPITISVDDTSGPRPHG